MIWTAAEVQSLSPWVTPTPPKISSKSSIHTTFLSNLLNLADNQNTLSAFLVEVNTGRAKKSNPLGKTVGIFSPNLQCLQRRIQATYPANFTAIFGYIIAI